MLTNCLISKSAENAIKLVKLQTLKEKLHINNDDTRQACLRTIHYSAQTVTAFACVSVTLERLKITRESLHSSVDFELSCTVY